MLPQIDEKVDPDKQHFLEEQENEDHKDVDGLEEEEQEDSEEEEEVNDSLNLLQESFKEHKNET